VQTLNIAIIEDEEDILELIEYHLNEAGFYTFGIIEPLHIKDILKNNDINLIIADNEFVNFDMQKFINSIKEDIPVLYLSSVNLQADFIKKPFEFSDLVAKVKQCLKK
jgi:DNA-binding response OmpR family regulator